MCRPDANILARLWEGYRQPATPAAARIGRAHTYEP